MELIVPAVSQQVPSVDVVQIQYRRVVLSDSFFIWPLCLDLVTSRLGAGIPKPLHAPGPLSFSDAGHVSRILTDAAFTAVDVEQVSTVIDGSTAEQEAEFACLMGPSGSLVSERAADQTALAAIKRDLVTAFGAFATAAGLRLPASVFVVRATRG